MNPERSPGPDYDAFISYRRKADREAAVTIQAGLQKFGTVGFRDKKTRVFRDDTDLLAGRPLPASIVNALSGSRWLILLASPESAHSPSVTTELNYWFGMNRQQETLIILTAGHLDWEGSTVTDASTALSRQFAHSFPDTPLFLDATWMRQAGNDIALDPRFDELLSTLIAPIRGISPREANLANRASRRRRTRTIAAIIALLCMLTIVAVVMGGLQYKERVRAVHNLHKSISTSLVAQSKTIGDRDPDLARQLLAVASRYDDTDMVRAAILESTQFPDVVPVGGLPRDVSISDDGSILAVASDAGTTVFNLDSGAKVGQIRGVAGYTGAIAISPDGRTIATGGRNGDVQLIRLNDDRQSIAGSGTRRLVRSDGGLNANGIINQVVFDRSGHNLTIVNGHDSVAQIQIADAFRESQIRFFWSPPGGAQEFLLSKDGTVGAAVRDDGVTVFTLDSTSYVPHGSIDAGRSITASLSDSGHKILVASGNSAKVWDISAPDHPLPQGYVVEGGFRIEGAAFSQNDRVLVVGVTGGENRLWDLTDPLNPVAGDLLPGAVTSLPQSTFSPGGEQVVTFATGTGPADGVSTNGTGGEVEHGSVKVWPIRGAKRIGLPESSLISGAGPRFSTSGKFMLTGFNLPIITELATGRQWRISDLAVSQSIQAGAEFLDGSSTEIVAKHPASVYSLDSQVLRVSSAHSLWSESESIASVPNSRDVLTYSTTDGARLWNSSERDELFTVGPVVAHGAVRCAGFSPSGQFVALCLDGHAAVYKRGNSAPVATVDSPATSVAFIDDSTLAIGGGSGAISTYRISPSGLDEIWSRTRRSSGISALSSAAQTGMLASIDNEGLLTLWTATKSQFPVEVMTIDTSGSNLGSTFALSSDGIYLAVSDKTAENSYVFYIDPMRVLRRICSRTRPISEAEWNEYVPGERFEQPCRR